MLVFATRPDMNTQKKYTNARELINQGWAVGDAIKKTGLTNAMYYYYKGKEPSTSVVVHGGANLVQEPKTQPRAYNKPGKVLAFYGTPEDLARIFKGAL